MTTLDTQGRTLVGDEKVAVDQKGTDTRAGASLSYTNYTGETGNSRHITRREYGTIPLAAILTFRGMMRENPRDHYEGTSTHTNRWEEFLQDITANGIKQAIFLNVDHGKDPMVNEGNHRREAARVLSLEVVPIEIAYYGHAEDQGTVLDRYVASL